MNESDRADLHTVKQEPPTPTQKKKILLLEKHDN